MESKNRQCSISFVGQYELSVLGDHRIVLPANLIRQLEGNGTEEVLPGRIPGLRALILCPGNLWGKWLKKLKRGFPCLDTYGGARAFITPWEPTRWDSKGRITLPRRAREYAGIKAHDTVVVIGADYYIELWADEEFTRMTRECETGLGELA